MPHSSFPLPDPALSALFTKKKRVYIACLHCRKRKIRCITNETTDTPCARCTEKGLECRYVAVANERRVPSSPDGRRKRERLPPSSPTTSEDNVTHSPALSSSLSPATPRSPNEMITKRSNSASASPQLLTADLRSFDHSEYNELEPVYSSNMSYGGVIRTSSARSSASVSPRGVQSSLRGELSASPSPPHALHTPHTPQYNLLPSLPGDSEQAGHEYGYGGYAYGYDVRHSHGQDIQVLSPLPLHLQPPADCHVMNMYSSTHGHGHAQPESYHGHSHNYACSGDWRC
ncbi:hypothetical protein FB45DRAFT_927894 [Roridomyces roridus]|uniref:Zn(2)-C6 fungal-type domain-containing protein n=1 Tax=Roridomyces roridus TaxID=1738132 RepID=A0AAD7BJJ3_9AGAR|nr:hypothetical protein FB45DRAFT_927894 [Roridomyces roridus]